jgi:hypothetical protein
MGQVEIFKRNKVMKLIDKDAVLAEIERRRNDYINSFMTEQVHTLSDMLDFIDTLEVKEVDEESYVMGKTGKFTTTTK